MGDGPLEWLLPLKDSPCSRHEEGESAFRLGPVVRRMRKEAGIALPEGNEGEKRRRRRRRRRREDGKERDEVEKKGRRRRRSRPRDLESGEAEGLGEIQVPVNAVVR